MDLHCASSPSTLHSGVIVQGRKAYNEGLELNRCTVLWYDILFGVGRRMDLQPARLNTLHIGLLFSVGRHTTRVWSSTDVLYCGMILFSVGIQMVLQAAH